jgi:bifunctional oligoribonuclease and PAP phosphatase NrnA
MTQAELIRKIKNANSFAIITHEKPDGDAVSSMLATSMFLNQLGKKVFIFSLADLLDQFSFLPGIMHVSDKVTGIFDLVLAVDYHVPKRGEYSPDIFGDTPIIAIDHHPTVEIDRFKGFIDPKASSTTEVIYGLVDKMKLPIDKSLATCLLTGIVTDTNSFQNQNTSDRTLKIAGELLNKGANLQRIMQWIYGKKTLNAWKLLGKALTNLQTNRRYGLVYTYLTSYDLAKLGVLKDEIGGISNFLILSLREARIIMTLIEEDDGLIKVSLRTRDKAVNLTKVAEIFGGGGHKGASGFKIEGKILEKDGKVEIISV